MRPRSLTVLAWIFILCGASAVWEMVEALLSNSVSINFGVLMIPVGIGLLKGRASSVKWAKVWICLFAALILALAVGYVFWGDSYHVGWYEQELQGVTRHLIAAASVLVLGGVCFLGWRILLSTAVRGYVESKVPQTIEFV